MSRGFLILTVSAGEVLYKTLAVASALGDPGFEKVSRIAQRFGYAVKSDGHRRSPQEREEWPLTVRAYTSFRRDGRGRSGSSLWSYPAKALPCGRCRGRGYTGGDRLSACKTCNGSAASSRR